MADGRRGGILTKLVVALVLLALLWVGYWYAARWAVLAGTGRLTAAHAGGAEIACPNLTIGGFPLYLDVTCGRATYAAGGDSLTAALGGLSATAPLYWPGDVAAKLDGPFVVNAPGKGLALTVNWSAASARVSAGIGGLKGFGAEVASLDAESAAGTAGAPLTAVTAATATAKLEPARDASFTFSADIAKLVLTLADGRVFPTIDAETKLTALNVGGALGTNPADTLRAWAKKGGTVAIDKLKVAAAGAIVILSGKLSLSADGLLNGSILVQYNSIDAIADLLEAIRPGTRDHYASALSVLNGVTLPADTEDGPVHQTTVSFIDGSIWLGIIPLPVDPLPAIRL